MFQRFRKYVRSKTGYIDPTYAALAKNKLALMYMFGAWNVFGLVVAALYREKIPKTHDSYDYAKVLGIKEAKVINLSGMSVVNEYELQFTDQDIEDFHKVIGTDEELKDYEKRNQERFDADNNKMKSINT